MYKTNYYQINNIHILEKEWKQLEKGTSMTYFQTFDWYQSILSNIPKDCKNYESRIVALYNDEIIKVIAPIFVIKSTFKLINKKGVYLLGHGGWSDYLDFIYDNDVSKDDLKFLLEDIKIHYGCNNFYFDDLPEKSLLYSTIVNSYDVAIDEKTICIELGLPENEETYLKLLSKNSKQNIRTAVNRLKKSDLEIVFNFDDKDVDKSHCEIMREIRLPRKQGKYNLLQRLKIRIVTFLHFFFHYDLPFYADTNSHIMTSYINDELAAYFNYGIDLFHKRIVLMAVGTSEKYGWYSPGVLLIYEYIKREISRREIEVIDFTRGNEKYKYSLGGKEHYNHHVVFSIS